VLRIAAWTLALAMLGLGGLLVVRQVSTPHEEVHVAATRIQPPVQRRPPQPPEPADFETPYALVLSSIQSAQLFCQAAEELPKKVKGMKIARAMSDSNVADLYASQAQQLESNIDKGANQFATLVAALRRREREPIRQALDAREQAATPSEGAFIELLRARVFASGEGPRIVPDDCPGIAAR
jgi:hypothetical protein